MEASIEVRLDSSVLKRAQRYAASHKRSLSDVIAAYLRGLPDSAETQTNEDSDITPFVKSMATGVHVPTDVDEKGMMRAKATRKHS
jgi:hypothetical protein